MNPGGMPRVETVLEDLFGWKTRAWITNVEYQLASKTRFRVAKDFGRDRVFGFRQRC